jgi:two-component system LytT family sensor kinase
LIKEKNKSDDIKFRRWWRSGFFIFAFFTLLTLINIPDIYFYYRESATSPASMIAAFGRLVLTNYLWVALVPLIFRVGDAFPVGRSKLIRNLIVHLFSGFAVGAVYTITFYLIFELFGGLTFDQLVNDMFQNAPVFLHNVKNGFIYYVGIQTFNQAANYSRKFQEREFHLQQAELKALKSQLNPHFLFNTLNAISALVYRSPEKADQTITQLSDLLRISLEGGKTEEILLAEELEFLRAYLQIHQTLMNERLAIEWRVAPETFAAAVPNMILQPLVENAVEHGLAPLKKGGRVSISASRNNGTLHLEVSDNGKGLAEKEKLQTGIGISNTRARLRFLYADDQELKIEDGKNGGLIVSIKIPFRALQEEGILS